MRQILFRGKSTDNGTQWVEGHYFETPLTDAATGSIPEDGWFFLTGRHRHCISAADGCVYEVDPDTVGEYTGLTDKNGRKIFEGDILKYGEISKRYGNIFPVVFEQRGESAYFGIKMDVIETWQFCLSVPTKLMEVIGNIHDNPELNKLTM